MEPIPEDLQRFLDGNIESLLQLEVLRILGEQPDKRWSTAELAVEVQTQAQTCALHVTALGSRGLLTAIMQGTDLVCHYGPRTAELEEMLRRLLQLYRERPVTMIKLVYARGSEPLRAFADSFRIRKER